MGVPIFFKICSDGPSSLIGLVISLIEKYLIKGLPINKTIIKDVNTASPVLKVIYLNTFKKEKHQQNSKENYKALVPTFFNLLTKLNKPVEFDPFTIK